MKHRNVLKKIHVIILGVVFTIGLLSPLIPISRDVNAGGPEVLTWKNRNSFEWAGAEGNPVETFRIVEPPLSNGLGGTIEWDPADKTGFQTRVETNLTDDERNAGTFCTYVNVVILVNTSDYNSTWNDEGGATPVDRVEVNEYSSSGCSFNDRLGIALDGLSESTIDPPISGGPGPGGGDSLTAEWVDRAHIKITRGDQDRIFKDGNIFDDRQVFENNEDDCDSKITLYNSDGNLSDTRSPQNKGEVDWETFSPNTNRCSQNAPIGGIDVDKGSGPRARRIIWFQRISESEIKAVDGKSDHLYEKVSTSNTKYNNTSQGECPDQVVATFDPVESRNIGPNRFELVGTNPRTTNDSGGCNDNDGNPKIAVGDALMYPIGQAPPGSDGATAGGFEAADCDAGEGLTWIICPTVRILAGAINSTAGLIEQMLEFPPDILSTTESTFSAWKGVRNLANVGLVLVFVVIIYSQATGGKE